MEGNFLFDIRDVIQNIERAEVMSVFFPTFRRALIVDTRYKDNVGPMVRLMPMARSPQDRMRSIRRARPEFPRPTNLTLVPWQRYVGSLISSGVWDKILDRLEESGDESVLRRLRGSPERTSPTGERRTHRRHHRQQLPYPLVRGRMTPLCLQYLSLAFPTVIPAKAGIQRP